MKNIGLIVRGKVRKKVILNLEIPNTPTLLAKKLNLERSSVSRTLLYLEKIKIIQCINPKEKIGRVYQLTTEGKKAKEIIKKM